MYYITVERDFDAAHALRGYRGKCENLHGHRFVVRATVKASGLDDIGLAYDFTVLKQHLSEILASFDHHNLNEVPPFVEKNPSSENIAALVFTEMKTRLGKAPVTLESVEVMESPTSSVVYKPD
jgi:6-pyruvoyltetrahydropterin/6-carboxytetrahydropterin synthase